MAGQKSKHLFRLSVDTKNFEKTIKNGIRFEDIEPYLTKEQKLKFSISKDGIVRCWGSLPGVSNKRNWGLLEEDDEILCYRGGKYICLGIISTKIINPKLAESLWGTTDIGSTWELMYFFEDVYFLDTPLEIINSQFGFKNSPVLGFNIISNQISQPFISKFGSISNFISSTKVNNFQTIQQQMITSPYEAQYYLLELGRILDFDTFVPITDAGRKAFGKELRELVTITKEKFLSYVPPVLIDTMSNIDVIWLTDGVRPAYCYEVVFKTGMEEAIARLDATSSYGVKNRIIGNEVMEAEYIRNRKLYFPTIESKISYKNFNQLIEAHTSAIDFNIIKNNFLSD